ncbi:hypothetical protein MASR2M70_11600 [Bacillota bacterium]
MLERAKTIVVCEELKSNRKELKSRIMVAFGVEKQPKTVRIPIFGCFFNRKAT